jgi:DNA repair protein RadD
MRFQLRPLQAEADENLSAEIDFCERRIVLQAPCGFGKTLLAAKRIHRNLESGKRSIFTAPALSLIDQTVERFYEYGINDIGVLQANHPLTAPHRKVQVCSVQTLARRNIPMADEVIIDEAHLQFDFVYDWMKRPEWQDIPFIGLTATPWARGMGKHYNKLIVAARLGDMVEQGWLKPLRYYAPMEIDTTGVKMVAGDYHEGQLSEASRKTTILSDTVNSWLEHANGRATIAFCVDRAHAQDMQARFMEVGVPCEYIDANTDAGERQAIGKRMESGQAKVCVSVGCLIAGLDWTFVNCVLFARKTKSQMLWVQGVGRGMRNHPGQEDCLLLDCAGNSELGHPYDIHYDSLDDGTAASKKKREDEKKEVKEPVKCKKCGAMRQPKLRACPVCGHIPTPPPSVSELDAKLREVHRAGVAPSTKEKALKDLARIEDMQEWYSSLLAIRDQRGYSKSWADVQFKERFGGWPEKVGLHNAALDAPSPMVSSWVTHRMIKFAKSKRR